MTTMSSIYGLKNSKCLVSQRANLSSDLFFVGTCHVNGDNELHLIQATSDSGAASSVLPASQTSATSAHKLSTQCLKIFRCDFGEITHMAAHLTNPDRLFVVGSRKTVLVDMSAAHNDTSTTTTHSTAPAATGEDGSTPATSAESPPPPRTKSNNSSADTLTIRHEFLHDASAAIRQVLWHPDEANEDLIARLTNKAIEIVRLGHDDNAPTFRRVVVDADLSEQLHWNPHRLSELAYAHARSIVGIDTRQSGSQAAWRIDDADALRVKTFDFNPNALHFLCCGGAEGVVRFYDIRATSQPVVRLGNHHEHWIRAVQYNKFNDRLVLSAGVDGVVNVFNIYSASSKLEHDESAESKAMQSGQLTKDKLLTSMSEHTDSVWSATWSAGDPRLLASVSYPGRVVVSKIASGD